MIKQTLLLLLLLTSFAAISQESRIIDDTPVGLGISVIDRQTGLKKHNVFHKIITPPTIIKTEKSSKGELYIKIYINSDEVEVIAAKINDSNKHLYKVFEKNTFLYDDTLRIRSASKLEREFVKPYGKGFRSFFTISTVLINTRQIHEYSIVEAQSGKLVSTLKLELAFPKPEPELLTIDKGRISPVEDRPGDNIFLGGTSIRTYKEQIISKNLVKTTFDHNASLPERLVLPQKINTFLIEFKR